MLSSFSSRSTFTALSKLRPEFAVLSFVLHMFLGRWKPSKPTNKMFHVNVSVNYSQSNRTVCMSATGTFIVLYDVSSEAFKSCNVIKLKAYEDL